MTSTVTPPPDLSALSPWAPELAQTFVTLSSDIALVLDDAGVIRSVAQGGATAIANASHAWVGRRWADTASADTRGKIGKLLEEVTTTGHARRREINHPTAPGVNVAIAYTAIRLGEDGPLLAVGRDLGAIAAIQQRFVEAQQELERGYWQARQAEARYRLLFQVATDAVLVVDAHSLEILEANRAAAELFDLAAEQVVGRPASFAFERQSRTAIDDLLLSVLASGQAAEIRGRLVGKVTPTCVAATPFKAGEAMRLLVRVRTIDMPGSASDLSATLARLVDGASDGVLVTDSTGRILIANPAFLKLVHLSTEAAVKGRPLMDWISVSDEQFAALLDQVRRQGISRRMTSWLLGADARAGQVELSAALLTEGDQECIGFTIHMSASAAAPADTDPFYAAMEQLSARIGATPLPELLRDAAVLLERHLIRVALERSEADPAAAARLLGISRERLHPPGESAPPGRE